MKITLKVFFVFLFLSLLMVRPASVFADWHGHDGWHHHDYVGVHFGVWQGSYYGYGYPYYGSPYYDSPYYDSPYYAQPYYYPEDAIVASSNYQPVVVNGGTYYMNNGVYYVYTQYGYQAVATPVGAVAPVIQSTTSTTGVGGGSVSDDSFTINIPNGKGGYNAVIIKRSGNGFVGPQGEFYADFPKVSQLQVMYGK